MLKTLISKYLYEPLKYDFFTQPREKGLSYYRFLKKSQWNSLEKNKEIQEKLLYDLLKYAQKNIPYYNKIFQKNNIFLNQNNVCEVLNDIPILTKEIIKKEDNNLFHIRNNISYFFNTSGGSTGQPVKLIQDISFKRKQELIGKLSEEWVGYQTGNTKITLWGSEKEIFKINSSLKTKVVYWITSDYLLNSFRMDDQIMKSYVEFINKKKPILIVAYVQSIYELSKFVIKNNIPVTSPKSIITSAGTLYPSFRDTIKNAFNCPVINRYGSREVGGIAFECDRQEGLHMNMFSQYIEILNKNLQPCREGEIGEIYITLLTNYTMPLIRYKIGDMATFTNRKCSCGRGLPLIENIVGRNVDLFINTNNEMIDGEYFTHILYFREYIKQFQIIQKSPELIILKIVLNSEQDKKILENDYDDIKDKIRIVMGKECKIEFEIVDEIKPLGSGKYRYTIRDFNLGDLHN